MNSWIFANQQSPYPTEEEKSKLLQATGLTSSQLNNWFSNARRRILKKMKTADFERHQYYEKKYGNPKILNEIFGVKSTGKKKKKILLLTNLKIKNYDRK